MDVGVGDWEWGEDDDGDVKVGCSCGRVLGYMVVCFLYIMV